MFGSEMFGTGTTLAIGIGVGVFATVLLRKSSLMSNMKTIGAQVDITCIIFVLEIMLILIVIVIFLNNGDYMYLGITY